MRSSPEGPVLGLSLFRPAAQATAAQWSRRSSAASTGAARRLPRVRGSASVAPGLGASGRGRMLPPAGALRRRTGSGGSPPACPGGGSGRGIPRFVGPGPRAAAESRLVTVVVSPLAVTSATRRLLAACVVMPASAAPYSAASMPSRRTARHHAGNRSGSAAALATASTRRLARQSWAETGRPSDRNALPIVAAAAPCAGIQTSLPLAWPRARGVSRTFMTIPPCAGMNTLRVKCGCRAQRQPIQEPTAVRDDRRRGDAQGQYHPQRPELGPRRRVDPVGWQTVRQGR